MITLNNYLIKLGSNVSELRQILNLTQEELANMMGISRPTLVKIEQDPSKLTKTLAFALFCSIAIETKRRVKEMSGVSAEDYGKIEKIYNLANKLKGVSAISAVNLGKIATVSTLIPGISSFINSSIKNNMSNLKDAALEQLKESANWNEEKAKKLIKEVEKKVLEAERESLSFFNLISWDVEEFGNNIDKGEIGN